MRKTKDTRIYRCCEKIPTFAASIPCAARLRKRLFSMRSHYPFFAYFSRSHYLLFYCVKPRRDTCSAQPSQPSLYPSRFSFKRDKGYTIHDTGYTIHDTRYWLKEKRFSMLLKKYRDFFNKPLSLVCIRKTKDKYPSFVKIICLLF